ncbi:MAG TPA: hypothetical protein VIC28_16285, partial [Thermoanaerobaculia bacterium]
FDHGAIAERVRERGGGLLVPLQASAAGIAAAIAALAGGGEMPRLRPPVATVEAAAAFLNLYGELGLS